MATNITLDFTSQINQNEENGIIFSPSLYDYCVIQAVDVPVGIEIYGSNDGGAIEGVRDGSAQTATNFSYVSSENMETGFVSYTIPAGTGSYRILAPFTNYIKLVSLHPDPIAKVIVFLSKIY